MGRPKCGEDDFERWYARTAKNKECLMGHKVCCRPSNASVCMRTDGDRDDSNGTDAASPARTATLVTSSRTPFSTKRIALARTRTTSGASHRAFCIRARDKRNGLVRSDYNYVRHDSSCVPVGPEPIPAGVCKSQDQTYMGSSGYRIIPGNTCDRNKGVKKDNPTEKKCSQGGYLPCLDAPTLMRVCFYYSATEGGECYPPNGARACCMTDVDS